MKFRQAIAEEYAYREQKRERIVGVVSFAAHSSGNYILLSRTTDEDRMGIDQAEPISKTLSLRRRNFQFSIFLSTDLWLSLFLG